MPKSWHDRYAVSAMEDGAERDFYRSIVADKKPYFMRYIYPALMKKYNTYRKNTDRNALREFQMTVDELKALPEEKRTERQREFLRYYDHSMPVGVGDCVMNRICRRFEEAFDGFVSRNNTAAGFDYRFMRGDAEYTPRQLSEIKRLRDDYNRRLQNYAMFADYERVDGDDSCATLAMMNEEFRKQCDGVCPNSEALCNILLDICYTKSSTKRFVWSMCGDDILRNLLAKSGGEISYPAMDGDGDFEYGGERFSVRTIHIEVDECRLF